MKKRTIILIALAVLLTMIIFGGAMHGFSNPEASHHGMPGVAYDARIAERAWQDTLAFLARILGPARD